MRSWCRRASRTRHANFRFLLIGIGLLFAGFVYGFFKFIHVNNNSRDRGESAHTKIDLQSDSDNSRISAVRILCWVMTSPNTLKSKAMHAMQTWGKRCTKILLVSEGNEDGLPSVVVVNAGSGREHLTAKTMQAFDYIYEHHLNDSDWFMKADDDTFVVLENLRYFLSTQDPTEPIYFGHHFHALVKPQGHFSGGAGYILSREALVRYGKRSKGLCSADGGAEGVELAVCMVKLGVRTGDSRDSLNRSRFHCFEPRDHVLGKFPDWYLTYDKYGAKSGIDAISDYAISFHYVSVPLMYQLEFFLYHLRTYGVAVKQRNLNRPHERIDTTARRTGYSSN